MSVLREFVGTKVKVLTSDGHVFIGNLEGYDQNTNVVLTKSKERVFSIDKESVSQACAGVIIRGDDIVGVGLFDEEIEDSTDYSGIFAAKLKDSKNALKRDVR